MSTPKKAGEKTRQKLRDAGVDPSISERAGLTLDEAYSALNDVRELQAAEFAGVIKEARGPFPQGHLEVPFPEDSDDTQEVVGESNYQDYLWRVFNKRSVTDYEAPAWAVLHPEPENRHDSNAVAVFVDGGKVGYLPSYDAEEIQQYLLKLEYQLRAKACCSCTIIGRDLLGVLLDLNLEEFTKWIKATLRSASKPNVVPPPPPPPTYKIHAGQQTLQRPPEAPRYAMGVAPGDLIQHFKTKNLAPLVAQYSAAKQKIKIPSINPKWFLGGLLLIAAFPAVKWGFTEVITFVRIMF